MTAGQPALFDPGLQPERTQLAWRRTVASVTIAALVSLRVLPPVLGAWAAVAATAGVVVGGVLWVAAGRRAVAIDRALRSPTGRLPDGALPFVLVLFVTVGAVVAAFALVRGLRGL